MFEEDSSGGVEVNKVDSSDIWHRRLGHPSKAIMSLFSRKMGLFETKCIDKLCDVCFRAKQNRLSFALGGNKVAVVFI